MALNFGAGGIFNVEEDGTFARKNIQINRDDVQPPLQNAGDMVLWEHGAGYIYDSYNSSIDGAKWTTNTAHTGCMTAASVSETATYLKCAITWDTTAGAATWTCYVSTNNLPALADMELIEFSTHRDYSANTWINVDNVNIFGTSFNPSNATHAWKCIKKLDGDWLIYKDTVLVSTITPTTNIITVGGAWAGVYAGWGAGWNNHYLYELKVGGGTYLLIKSTQRTFAIDLASF